MPINNQYIYFSEKDNSEVEPEELTVDLSNRGLKKIEKATDEQKDACNLILDENNIPKIENVDSYGNLKKVNFTFQLSPHFAGNVNN